MRYDPRAIALAIALGISYYSSNIGKDERARDSNRCSLGYIAIKQPTLDTNQHQMRHKSVSDRLIELQTGVR